MSSRTGSFRSGTELCLCAMRLFPVPGEPVTAGVPARNGIGGGGHAVPCGNLAAGGSLAILRIIHTHAGAVDRMPASRDAAWTRSAPPPIPGTGRTRRGCDQAATAECGQSSVRLQGWKCLLAPASGPGPLENGPDADPGRDRDLLWFKKA